jgi:NAD(P)-dependent dehydrogenase (short-subunit alcohol dehydrogenase family)
MLLESKVGIVSGVGPGIGRAIALAFAREGADVALGGLMEDTMRDVAAEVEALGRRVISVPTDVTEPEQCEHLAEATYAAFGRIDVLVNNAFVSRPVVTLAESDLADWRPAMEVNFWGSLSMTKAVVPYMRERGDGRVIMRSSSTNHGIEGWGAYTSSKGALRTMCRILAKELGPWGIRVNTVTPGFTDGPTIERFFAEQAQRLGVDARAVREQSAAENALRYIPSADEVAGAVVFFASELGRAATGQYLLVNGGRYFD